MDAMSRSKEHQDPYENKNREKYHAKTNPLSCTIYDSNGRINKLRIKYNAS